MSEVFRISKDKERARDLFKMAKERFEDSKNFSKEKTYRIIEDYYETSVQLIMALMYLEGFKTLSHTELIEYLKRNYKSFTAHEITLLDMMRKFRHGSVYYGKKVEIEFLINNDKLITSIIKKLFEIVGEKLK